VKVQYVYDQLSIIQFYLNLSIISSLVAFTVLGLSFWRPTLISGLFKTPFGDEISPFQMYTSLCFVLFFNFSFDVNGKKIIYYQM
jgi:hypothetical protein